MRRGTMLAAAIAVMVALFAGAAYAAVVTIQGTQDNDVLFESPGDDTIDGHDGDDKIWAEAFPYDVDVLRGQSGRDTLDAQDQDYNDTLNGGANRDRCIGDKGDTFIECEIIK
jgi:Ca2+-binding RTX toxin-like protein